MIHINELITEGQKDMPSIAKDFFHAKEVDRKLLQVECLAMLDARRLVNNESNNTLDSTASYK